MPATAVQHHHQSWLRRRNLLRLELLAVAAFHLIGAVTLVAAPREQVITSSTEVIFGTIPLEVWFCWWLLTGVAALSTVIEVKPLRLWLTWCGTFPLGAAWIWGASAALADGGGNALFTLAWPFLLLWWTFTAIRMELGRPEAWWGGS